MFPHFENGITHGISILRVICPPTAEKLGYHADATAKSGTEIRTMSRERFLLLGKTLVCEVFVKG